MPGDTWHEEVFSTSVERVLDADPASVRLARWFARDTLVGWGLGALGGDVLVVVSELTSNAVQADQVCGSGEVLVRLCRTEQSIYVEVGDHNPQPPSPPEVTHLSPVCERGRGLMLAAALSSGLGWYVDGRNWKFVWAGFVIPPIRRAEAVTGSIAQVGAAVWETGTPAVSGASQPGHTGAGASECEVLPMGEGRRVLAGQASSADRGRPFLAAAACLSGSFVAVMPSPAEAGGRMAAPSAPLDKAAGLLDIPVTEVSVTEMGRRALAAGEVQPDWLADLLAVLVLMEDERKAMQKRHGINTSLRRVPGRLWTLFRRAAEEIVCLVEAAYDIYVLGR
ncbi:MAG TPA: ATP-binding protein [Streptosporangiaceae bacterium]|nr:ATP-binding protein [Streptosporangiaceae bacterium]